MLVARVKGTETLRDLHLQCHLNGGIFN
jgi:hypothetical protein